jgi:para-nitrobenzyl esterase
MKSAIRKISSGKIQGLVRDGVHRYLGVPYAEPPFGEARFLPPVRRRPWDGVFDAGRYGAICPQTGGVQLGMPDEGEDCLNLNVWTPDPSARGLPVMVWAHGGGQTTGTGAIKLYDGTNFAKSGVVLVTNNRRLGAEGYLYLPEFFGDGVGPGNLGILDQIEVLRWVQENIEQFGGDPNNVTLFGESGGGAATQAVIATPESKGLVHRVIPQSGGHAAQRGESASAITEHVMKKLRIARGDIDALRQVPWKVFVELYDELEQLGLGRPQVYLPVISEDMPYHPVDAMDAGLGAEIDYLIGTCRDEINLFNVLIPGGLEGSVFDRRARLVVEKSRADWDQLVSVYRNTRPDLDAEGAVNAIMGDMWFRVPSIRIADRHAEQGKGRTWMYLFTWESQTLGAAHAMDLMVFGNGVPFGPLAGFASYDQTAAFMHKAWVNFARDGDPGWESFRWPAYDLKHRNTVALNETPAILQDPYEQQRGLLAHALSENWQALGL